MAKISLVIPAYNEEKRIKKTLKEFITYFRQRFEEFEIIVVCDGCNDRTPQIVKDCIKKENNVRILEFPEKLGKGGGVMEGFKKSNGDIIGFIDADLSISPIQFNKLIRNVENGVECAIASRRVKGAEIVVKQPLIRRYMSKIFNMMVQLLSGLDIKDTQCGGKCFKREVIHSVLPEMKFKDYVFDVELLYKINRHGYRIAEIPITWRHAEEGQFDYIKDGFRMLIDLIKIRFGEN